MTAIRPSTAHETNAGPSRNTRLRAVGTAVPWAWPHASIGTLAAAGCTAANRARAIAEGAALFATGTDAT